MIYVDTSLLVALHVVERDSAMAMTWFQRRAGETFIYSDWTNLEVASALSRKIRGGTMSVGDRQLAEQAIRLTTRDSFQHVAIMPEHFRFAELMVRRFETGLRASDALHLAIADSCSASMATLDHVFASAATQLGIAVEQLV